MLVYVARGVPLLMLILWVYFLVPLLIGTRRLGLHHDAVHAGDLRGRLPVARWCAPASQALPQGQMEAARALGHSYLGAMWYVILPQALYNMLPSMLSQFVSTIKETTLGYVINVPELTFAANQINNQLLTKPFQVFFILAIIYYVVCWSLTQLRAMAGAAHRHASAPGAAGAAAAASSARQPR